MNRQKDYIQGSLESSKFSAQKPLYYEGLEKIKLMGYSFEDLVQYFPCFTGHQTLTRFLTLYEIYKSTLGLSGHIAEVGIYKAASTIFFSKLVKIFESNSFTQVHGFDWFQGNKPSEEEEFIVSGADVESYDRVCELVNAQDLSNITKIHKVDVTTELDSFFKENSHLQFKIIFLDAGMYEVVKTCLPFFWERLVKGGCLILDQYNFDIAPGETKAINEFFNHSVEIKTFPWGWMPTAYIIK